MEVFKVFSQDKVLQRFVEQIIDDDKVGWTGSTAFRGAELRNAPPRAWWKFGASLVVQFCDVIKFARAVSPGNLDIDSTSSSSGRHLLSF